MSVGEALTNLVFARITDLRVNTHYYIKFFQFMCIFKYVHVGIYYK